MSQSLPLTPEIIGRALDNAKLTPQLKFIIGVAAAGFLFDSFDITIVAYALPKIRQEFNLTPQQVGLAGSAALAGMGVGSWCWGWVADKWGRRVVFAATVLMFSLFTGVVGLSMSLGFLVGARFLTGLGLGGMVPIDQALVTEYAPADIRGRVAATLPLCWPMGYFFAAGAGLVLVPEIGWRWLFAIGVLPALLVVFIRRGVPESPRWLAAKGRHEEARASLHYVGVTDAAIEAARAQVALEPVKPKIPDPTFADLFKPEYIRRVIHTWVLWFCAAFAGTGFREKPEPDRGSVKTAPGSTCDAARPEIPLGTGRAVFIQSAGKSPRHRDPDRDAGIARRHDRRKWPPAHPASNV